MMGSMRFQAMLWAALCGAVFLGCRDTRPTTAMDVKVLVGLQKTPCFGQCPVYELAVLNTGEATLMVVRNCDEAFGRALEPGLHRGKADVGMWRMVTDMAANLGFDTLQARYDNPIIMDLPANIVTIEGKTVYNRYGGPNFNDLCTRIERLAGMVDWQADPASAR